MKNQKSSGSDCITADFYKIFLHDIKAYYLKSINFSFQNQELTELQKQSVITLSPKPGKDKKVQVGKDQAKPQSEKDSHSKNRGGKKPNQQSGTYTMINIVSRMSSYFPNRWPLSYLNLTKNMKTYIGRQQHKKFKHQDIKQKEPPQKDTSRQRSGKGAIRKRFPLQKPRREKTKPTIRYLYHENIS